MGPEIIRRAAQGGEKGGGEQEEKEEQEEEKEKKEDDTQLGLHAPPILGSTPLMAWSWSFILVWNLDQTIAGSMY